LSTDDLLKHLSTEARQGRLNAKGRSMLKQLLEELDGKPQS
jgi:hypothetical protein